MEDLAGQDVAAVDQQFATYLGLFLLAEQGIQIAGVAFKESWLQVIRAVAAGEIKFGILYYDFYNSLSKLTHSRFSTVHISRTRRATHLLLLRSARLDKRVAIEKTLSQMHSIPEGRTILARLGLGRWVPETGLEEVERIITVANRLVESTR